MDPVFWAACFHIRQVALGRARKSFQVAVKLQPVLSETFGGDQPLGAIDAGQLRGGDLLFCKPDIE